MNSIKSVCKKIIQLAAAPLAVAWFWIFRWYRHNDFVSAMNSPALGRPALASRPLLTLARATRVWSRQFYAKFNEYALEQYVKFVPRHYAKGGWGYMTLEGLTDQECAAKFGSLGSRITPYFTNNSKLAVYRDGESFLDVGCGMGQIIKELVHRFPQSPITGFDVNEAALRVARVGTKHTDRVSLEVGSAFDFNYLKKYADNSFDHVVMSHVLSHLLAPGVEATIEKRQALIDELVRIARKSVLLIEAIYHWPGEDVHNGVYFKIEQNSRSALIEPIANYFHKYKTRGEFCMLFGAESSSAIYFRKN